MERTTRTRRVKSPQFFQEERSRSTVRSPSRRSPSRNRGRSRSRTPARSRKAATTQNANVAPTISPKSSENPVVVLEKVERSAPVSGVNGAEKWKPNFTIFKPTIKVDRKAILATILDVLSVNAAAALTTLFVITLIFSYLLCNKSRCKLPTKVPSFSKLTFDVTPLSAYIYAGFLTVQFLFTFIPKHSNIASFVISVLSVLALNFYPVYPVTSLLEKPVEFIQLALITSFVIGLILFGKGYTKVNDDTSDKLIYGYLFGFRNNGLVFGNKIEAILHQISFIQLAVLDVLFGIKLYEAEFPILFTTALVLHFLFVLEKVFFVNKKDFVDINPGFFSVFLTLIYPSVSSVGIYATYKLALKEHTFYEFAGIAAAFWVFGFYSYCKAKYDPPRRMATRYVKGFLKRLGYIWNIIVTSPWIGQSFIELSIAGVVLPYSYLSLIVSVGYIALTKVLPTLY